MLQRKEVAGDLYSDSHAFTFFFYFAAQSQTLLLHAIGGRGREKRNFSLPEQSGKGA